MGADIVANGAPERLKRGPHLPELFSEFPERPARFPENYARRFMIRERVQPVEDPRDERLRFGDFSAGRRQLRFHRDLVARRLQRFDPPLKIPHVGIQAPREIA